MCQESLTWTNLQIKSKEDGQISTRIYIKIKTLARTNLQRRKKMILTEILLINYNYKSE